MAQPLYDARLHGFPVAVRLTALYTAAVGAAVATIDGSVWGVLVGLMGAIALVRLPRRTRLVECAFALALLPAVAPELLWACVAGVVMCVGLVFVAPEDRKQALNGLDRLFISTDYAGVMDYHLWFDADEVDDLALRSAVRDLLREVPLARTFVRSSFWGSERFSAPLGAFDDTDVVRVHTADAETVMDQIFNTTMPVDMRPPFRVDVFPSGTGSRLMFSFHHSFVDGTGALYMLDLFAERYDLAQGRPPAHRTPLPPGPKRIRECFADRTLGWKLALVRQTLGKRLQAGTRYAAVHDRKGHDMGRAKLAAMHVDKAAYARYRQAARRLGCSTNTLIVACALGAAIRWRKQRELPAEPLRSLVATDIREQLDLPRSLQNWVSQIAVVIPEDTCEVADLVAALDEGLQRAKGGEAVDQTLRLAINAAVYPTAVGRNMFARRDTDPETHTLSLGATTLRWNDEGPLATSSLRVEHLDLLGPVSRVPGLTLFASGTREDLRINLGYRDGVLSDDGADRFVELVTAELDRACASSNRRADVQ